MRSSYAPDRIQTNFEQIRAIAPAAVILRTDQRLRPGPGQFTAQIAKASRRQNIDLGESAEHPHAGAVRALGQFFGVSEPQAVTLFRSIHEVASLNSRGAWCLQPANEATASTATPHPFVQELIEALGDCMPDAGRIEADVYLQPTTMGHERRRTFLRIRDRKGGELAALDTAHIAMHLQAAIHAKGEHTAINLARLDHWAVQMGVDKDSMPFVLHDLHGLFAQGAIRSIEFESGKVEC